MILNFLGEKKNVKNYDLPQEGFSGCYAQGKHETQVDCSQFVLPLPKYSHPEELKEVHNSLGLLVSIFLPRALDPYFCGSRITS